jgi:uncharacterized membrane protein
MRPGLNSVSVWFGAVMVLVITGLAFAILLTDLMSDRLYGNKRMLFIVLLFGYAIYRGFRIYQVVKYSGRNER